LTWINIGNARAGYKYDRAAGECPRHAGHAGPRFWEHPVRTHTNKGALLGIAFAVAASYAGGAIGADQDAAMAMMKKNDCTKCHAVDKDKKGPAFKKIAAKYKGKADAEDKLVKFVTTSSKVKLPDGSEEEHKTIDGDAKGTKNIVQWVLAQ
jgi:cytochrome c